jgi:adenylate cyclase
MRMARVRAFLSSDQALVWRRRLTRLAETGTAGYPEPVRRRLRIMNVAAYLIAGLTLVYTAGQILDFQIWKPVIFINLVLIAVTLAVPFLHRFHELAGALSVAFTEGVGLFVLTYLLGRESGLHMQYFVAIGGSFAILGLARLKLIIGIIAGSFVLHILAWALFTQERAPLRVQSYELDQLYITAVVSIVVVISGVVYYAFRLAEVAQEETDRLLHNMLPTPIVERLKSAPSSIIADEFADATVLFADLRGFVQLAKRLGPARTVGLLNILVSAFDDLAEEWRVEIKTIGDAYMVAAGIPEPATDHAERMAGMALAMLATLERVSRQQKVDLSLRIGVASGPVLAGVIGAKRLTYDVWGDTVNLASRLEGQCAQGRALVSRRTKALLEHRFTLERCGPLEIKCFGLEEAWYLVREDGRTPPQPASEASKARA